MMNSIDANLIKDGIISDDVVVKDQDLKAATISFDVIQILEAGKRGEEVKFYIGGRKFAIRELAQ